MQCSSSNAPTNNGSVVVIDFLWYLGFVGQPIKLLSLLQVRLNTCVTEFIHRSGQRVRRRFL